MHFVLRARQQECKARCKFVFWRDRENSIVNFLCYLLLGVMADPPILVPPKMVKSEDLHHHALEQLPNLTYCINDNPRWGKEVVIHSWQIYVLLSYLVLLYLCCEDGALLVVEAWKRSSTIFSCVQSWFCKEMSCCYCCMRFFVCLFVFSWLWFGRSCDFCVQEK